MRYFALILILLIIPLMGVVDGKETIVDQSFRIDGGQFESWEFDSEGSVILYISVRSQLWTFSMYLLDEDNFADLKNDKNFEYTYQASMIYNANLTWEVPEGKFFLVIVNEFDDLGVNLQIKIDTGGEADEACCGSVLVGSILVVGSLSAIIIFIRKRS